MKNGGTMLNPEQTAEYIRQAKNGNEKAKEILLVNNANLIKSIVKRFLGKGVEYDDLYQLGSLGFIKAIKNFNENYDVMFSTYAVPMIIGEIKRFMRDDGAVKVSRAIKVLAVKINRFIDEYRQKRNVSPTVDEIAKHFGVERQDVVFALDSSKYPLSLNTAEGEEDDGNPELIDRLPSREDGDDLVDKIMLRTFIERLPERDRKIIILRYFGDKTQSEIAAELGVSQVQVSRLENKIIEKLRSFCNGN
ncbi:MAG: SigB/SigF/SigG family RNA polymerase sigma factor [Clostridia bacterium]|nr:SigB/SigF/SigG family RNA polymerase sigma factor [Clostridia bacterium]